MTVDLTENEAADLFKLASAMRYECLKKSLSEREYYGLEFSLSLIVQKIIIAKD
jgi:hypothetical protein